jgi:hypothetical protein
LLLATADRSDELVDENVRLVLQELRQHLNMEVIFVSEIRNGQRMFQHVDTPRQGIDCYWRRRPSGRVVLPVRARRRSARSGP